ncbi:HAD-IB family hydrolase [Flagellatimonas centrodinii]|uniref:histidinol-phosphatase n=1 Tax=Flagellatimonas centrodinii TaxID=2806210 RepID=UPI001FEE0E6D|nr:HAD family hydrolase [Flagellatimonas centrodinii]ULQ45225.1 HAD-IB family hydrolase [Flagellatimonas centrodinii]
MRLAIFDLDHTLLAGDSDLLWGQYLCRLGVVDPAYYAAENLRFYQAYQAGTLDIHAFAAFSLKPLTEHPRAQLEAWRADFMQTVVEPIICPGADPLIARHRAEGAVTLIMTATNRFITEPIAARLGVDHLIATDPEEIDGRFTGRIAGTPNFQHGKVTRLAAWRQTQAEAADHVTFYSDSRNDLPLLEVADQAVAVDPDEVLRAEAEGRGWPIISLRSAPLKATDTP